MSALVHTAIVAASEPDVGAALVAALASADREAPVVVFFAHLKMDGRAIGDAIRTHFPNAVVLGCSANGAFSESGNGKEMCSAIVLPSTVVSQAAGVLVRIGQGVEPGIVAAAEALTATLGTPLRSLPHEKFVGLALLEGAGFHEEEINAALGNVAPALRFVGGSAGDDVTFSGTWAYCNGEFAADGCALAVMEMACPFAIVQACNFEPTGQTVTATRVAAGSRILEEIDGVPAAKFYAERAGKSVAELGFADFIGMPLGIMIDGKPWLRSPARVEGEGILFACSTVEGAELNIMQKRDLVEDTAKQLEEIEAALGGPIEGAVLFNCAYRMFEAMFGGSEARYHGMLSRFPHAGLHTNGETYLAHINQTLTGLVFRQS